MKILLLATAWGPKHGGINAFNSDFALGLAAELGDSGRVFCAVLDPSEADITYAKRQGVTLIPVKGKQQSDQFDASWVADVLEWLKSHADDAPITWWIGHDVTTGDAALRGAELAGGSAALIQHMSYIEYEGMKHDWADETVDKLRRQRELFQQNARLFAVGPFLCQACHTLTGQPVTQLVPGFPELSGSRSPDDSVVAVTFGRLDRASDRIKQGRLAVAGFGKALQLAGSREQLGITSRSAGRWRLYVIGLKRELSDEANEVRVLAETQAGRPVIVLPLPFDEGRKQLFDHLSESNLAMMLSWHEGFGLAGWEAIAAEVPLIVSQYSGLFQLVHETLGGSGTGCLRVIDVEGARGEEGVFNFTQPDLDAVAKQILRVAANLPEHKRDAVQLKKLLADKLGCTWRETARQFLQALSESRANANGSMSGRPDGLCVPANLIEAQAQAGVILEPPRLYSSPAYPLQANFIGRVAERRKLTDWYLSGQRPLLVLDAFSGMGKSALAWVWLTVDLLGNAFADVDPVASVTHDCRPEGAVWWSFYEASARFPVFVEKTLRYLGHDPQTMPSVYDRVQALRHELERRRLIVVLDGFERELRAYASLGASYQGDEEGDIEQSLRTCTDPDAARFLRELGGTSLASRILFTSRVLPAEIEGAANLSHVSLKGLLPRDAVAFFHAQGVKGTRAEIENVCTPYRYHPLVLRLMTGRIAFDFSQPNDVRALAHIRLPTTAIKQKERRNHILQAVYEPVTEDRRALLGLISAFRSPVTYNTLAAVDEERNSRDLDAGLKDLVGRGLLLFDRERARFDLHPIVRRFAYDRLADREVVHQRLFVHFEGAPKMAVEHLRHVEDLMREIECYHHALRAGFYDVASELFWKNLNDFLGFRLAAYPVIIELLRELFPDGEDKPPRLKSKVNLARASQALSGIYSLVGEGRRALPLAEVYLTIAVTQGTKSNVAAGLNELAVIHFGLGELATAEKLLRNSTRVSKMAPESLQEAIAHQELGRLLGKTGHIDEARRELDKAYRLFHRKKEIQSLSIVEAHRAELLLQSDAAGALAAATRARTRAKQADRNGFGGPRDFVRADRLTARALLMLAAQEPSKRDTRLAEVERYLRDALTECRRINLVESEPDILLVWAECRRLKGDSDAASAAAREALEIADRCEYRLAQADGHNFLAELALDASDNDMARQEAEIGKERALCDGPPHSYKPACDKAERLIMQASR